MYNVALTNSVAKRRVSIKSQSSNKFLLYKYIDKLEQYKKISPSMHNPEINFLTSKTFNRPATVVART